MNSWAVTFCEDVQQAGSRENGGGWGYGQGGLKRAVWHIPGETLQRLTLWHWKGGGEREKEKLFKWQDLLDLPN